MGSSRASSFGFSWFRNGLLTRSWRAVVALLCWALAVTTFVGLDAGRAEAAPKPPKAAPVASAKDLVSAQLTARAQGSRVEVEGLRDATSTTWVNPDGTLTTEAHAGPIRYRDSRGAWRDVDLTLAKQADGSVATKGHPLGVSLAGPTKGAGGSVRSATGTDLVVVEEGPGADKAEREVVLAWPGLLPVPSVTGTRATYPSVQPGVDVVVESRRSGYEQLTVVKDRATLDRLAAASDDGTVAIELDLRTKGLTARAEADGSVSFVDAKGVGVSRFDAPVAWDAQVDARSGEHVDVTPVAMTVTQQGKGRAVLRLTPDADWLADPDRVFPITIDPTYASATVYPSSDTYVNSSYPSANYASDTELRVGTYDGGTSKVRSFLTFALSTFKGKQVQSASLSLYEFWSWSCSARTFSVHEVAANSPASMTWSNQPAAGTNYGSLSVAKGYTSSCAAGRVSVPITSLIQKWSGSTATTGGMRLSASESDNYAWKKFYSVNSSTDPYITFTYNRKPNAAATPTVGSPANSYTNPSTGAVQIFTRDTTPLFSSSATDPDGNKVSVTFEVHTDTSGSTKVSSCATANGSSGATVSCSVGTALSDNKTYYVRAAVKDELGLWNGTWSGWRTFYTQVATPPAPKVSCTGGYDDGSWTDTDPTASVTCSITAAGVSGTYQAPGYLDVVVDGVTQARQTIVATNDWNVVHKTFSFAPTQRGYHEIKVTGLSRSLVATPQTVHGFGWGAASLTAPATATASSGKVKVTAGGPPKGSASQVSAVVQWRVAASGNESTGWTDAASGPATVTPSGTAAASYSTVFDLASAVREAGASADVPSRTPVRLDLQVCFTYSGATTSTQCTWSQSEVTVTRLPHAFGNGYPTADAGVGQVALYTGELSMAGTDISVPGYSGDITISRSHTSFAGDGTVAGWPSDPVTGVFGPGWTANLEGGEAGLAGLTVVDNTGVDGSIAFVDEDGEPLVFANPAETRTYPSAATTYEPATQDTAEAGIALRLSGTGTATRLVLTEEDGTATTWAPKAAPSPTAGTAWIPETIAEPGQSGKTTFGHDAAGRVTRIVAPVPDGMSGSACPTAGALARGCRALDIAYAAATTATASAPGDYTGRVKQASAWLWDPQTQAMAETVVAQYAYDTSGRLASVTDPRAGLSTQYTWDGTSTRIASVRSATLAATKLTYTSGKLTQVAKEAPKAGDADVVTARYAYGIPTSGSGLPDLTGTAAWNQAKAPVTGYAVFGQDYTGPVTGSGVDYTYGDLSYVDDLGYTVNTASYGAGAWLVTATDYDGQGNIVRQLDASATARAAADPNLSAADVDALSTQTVYNAEEKDATGAVVLAAGTRVTDTYGPARVVALADGTQLIARPHTSTTYDEGAPNGGINPATGMRYSLATTTVTAAAASGGGDLETLSTTTTSYGKLDPADATEGDGWSLGSPTRTTTGGITTVTRYDTMGRVTEQRQPLSNGGDAGTTRTAYYTAGAQSAPNADCGGHPEWAGLACRTYPAAAPSSGPTMPDARTTAYSRWLQPTEVVETSGTVTRTTTSTFDAANRPVSTKVTTSGLTGSTSRPGTFTKYRSDNGLVEYTGWLNAAGTDAETSGRTTSTYDRWGRATSVTDEAGTTTTVFDAAGRVQSTSDPKGTTTFGYDGTGERRGLVTSLSVTRGGSAGTLTYGATYDADGNLTRQTLPGGLTQVNRYDEGGQPVELTYLGQVTPVTEGTDPATGETTWTPGTPVQDQPWLTWSTVSDAMGRTRFESTGAGAAADDGDGVVTLGDVDPWTASAAGQASSYGREYRYDGAGRLTFVRDEQAGVDVSAGEFVTSCLDRTYSFDANGRRTHLVTATHEGGDCDAAATSADVATTGWDTADRPTTGRGGSGAYAYDAFGRQTSLPAADAPDPGAGDVTLGYFDDDLPRSVAQGGVTTTFTIDAAGRRSGQTTVGPEGTTTVLRRYADGSDNPSWIETTAPSGTSVTRFAESIGGDLSATIDASGGVSLSLANPHGDVVTSVDIPAEQAAGDAATAVSGWATYDEYGNTTTADAVDGPVGYGWLGAKQRSTSSATAGLTLMGVRLYNAARGLFTSVDPAPGGNDTVYAYPNDPVNSFDLDGRWPSWMKKVGQFVWKHKVDIALTALSFVPVVGVAAWGVRAGVLAYRGYRAYRAVRFAQKAVATAKRVKSYVRLGRGASGRIRLSIGQTKKGWIKNGGRGPRWNLHIDRGYGAFNHWGRGIYRKFWGK